MDNFTPAQQKIYEDLSADGKDEYHDARRKHPNWSIDKCLAKAKLEDTIIGVPDDTGGGGTGTGGSGSGGDLTFLKILQEVMSRFIPWIKNSDLDYSFVETVVVVVSSALSVIEEAISEIWKSIKRGVSVAAKWVAEQGKKAWKKITDFFS